ncbi:MAG: aryl-sulfate sulfotransferase [Rhodospirillaceae bacterium]|nr:aryl-sulfate sulfotransferase [Rhodospirillaceae bacterium]
MRKHSVNLGGHKTSISLENIFWDHIKNLAADRGLTVNQLLTEIDLDRTGNLSSAARVFVLENITNNTSTIDR